jgi:K+-sensing histidine kinase KdpD
VPRVVLRILRICLLAVSITLLLFATADLRHVNSTAVALVLVLIVLGTALRRGSLEALVAAIVAAMGLDYFFLAPRGFDVYEPQHWVA